MYGLETILVTNSNCKPIEAEQLRARLTQAFSVRNMSCTTVEIEAFLSARFIIQINHSTKQKTIFRIHQRLFPGVNILQSHGTKLMSILPTYPLRS